MDIIIHSHIIDVLGVVTTFNDVQQIIQRSTGRELIKRDINIVDDSGTMVSNLFTRQILKFCCFGQE